jgi:23S rRNA pseudouridine1911/1915/1917 synthase
MEKLFDIIDESDDFLVVNKPGDLVCHPTKGDVYSSLISRLRLYFAEKPEVSPSFVNRLDRETSGVIVIAKNPETHAAMQRAFQEGNVEKTYLAIVQGIPHSESGVIDQPLAREPGAEVVIKQAIVEGGAASITSWKLLETGNQFSQLEVKPKTGRLHQIRVHLASIGHSIVGDKLYGPDWRLYLEFIRTGWTLDLEKKLLIQRQMLHATRLQVEFKNKIWTWNAPIPSDMESFLEKHFSKSL